MAKKYKVLFQQPTVEEVRGTPVLTEAFVRAMQAHFAGGHTPAVRNALAQLLKATQDES